MAPSFESVDVSNAIEASLRIVDGRARERRISITTKIEQALPEIFADDRTLKQILMNLLSNAVKFTAEGGKVRLRARVLTGGGIEISVIDTGIGIAKSDLETVMAPFGQVESTLTRKFAGTGLGLPLTRSLVELHGGSLVVQSKQGTRVTIKPPAGDSPTAR